MIDRIRADFGDDAVSMAVLVAIVVVAVLLLLFLRKVARNSLVYMPNTMYGIVERKWSVRRPVEPFAPVAINGGAGFLPEVIRGGWHFFVPFQYRIHKRDLITVSQIGYLVARVGAPLKEGQTLGAWPPNVQVDDARAFLTLGGQRGPQRRILRSGTLAINTALFCVMTDVVILSMNGADEDDKRMQALIKGREGFDPLVIQDDTVGIVTVQDGPALQHGEIIAPAAGTDESQPDFFHNSFQDIDRFLAAGGRRGRQEQVMVDGTYYVNRLFATVEIKPKTRVEVGMVGVVNSFVGPDAGSTTPASAADGGRGRTVPVGQRGIWSRPFDPGKYAINPYAMTVIPVPTTNFQLRWMSGTSSAPLPGGISYDDDLKEIPVITHDAFEILLPLSIVAHISPANAPEVIQRFSQIERLVNQTLDPFISSYFKDAAQSRPLLDFIQKRSAIAAEALVAMRGRLSQQRIDIEEIMLGTPKPLDPEDDRMEVLFEQLRQRQIAVEQEQTFAMQRTAAMKRRELTEATAQAEQQEGVTRSALAITIAENEGKAETARRRQAADGIRAMAEAEAYATKARVEAIGGAENVIRQMALEALPLLVREAKTPLVPSVVAGGDGAGTAGPLGAILAMALGRAAAEASKDLSGRA